MTSIGNTAFYGCHGLTSVTIPEGMTHIGVGAFARCGNIKSITLPTSLEKVGIEAFNTVDEYYQEGDDGQWYAGHSLTDIYYGGSSMRWMAIGGNDAGVPAGVTIHYALESDSISGACGDNLTWTLDEDGLLTISGVGAMWNRWDESYEKELLPAWRNYTIKKIVIDDGVTSIGVCAFQDCSSLTEVVIAGTVNEIGSDAFTNCAALKEVTISGAGVSVICDAFYGCDSLTTINYGGTMAQWKDGAGATVALPLCASVNCTNGTITPTLNGPCGTNARYSISSAGVLTISGTGAMADYTYDGYTDSSDCPWHSVRYAVKEIVIEDGITHIGNCAFMFDVNATSVTIPNSVTSVGDWAFCGCYNLTEITLPEGLESIGEGAFSFCTALTDVSISNGVTSIGVDAFAECSGLTRITIPDSVTSLGTETFLGCTSLTEVTIPASVTSLGEAVFYGCTSLTTINFGGTEAQWNAIGGNDAGVPETATVIFAVSLETELKTAGFTTPENFAVNVPCWSEDEYPDLCCLNMDISTGEITLTLKRASSEAWNAAYQKSVEWFNDYSKIMCTVPCYAPGYVKNSTTGSYTSNGYYYSACMTSDDSEALDFINNYDSYMWYGYGGDPIDGCFWGTGIASVGNGQISSLGNHRVYYMVVWYDANANEICKYALKINIVSEEPFSYSTTTTDAGTKLREAGYTVPDTSQFFVNAPTGLIEGTDYIYRYDPTTGHVTIKLLKGNAAHWRKAYQAVADEGLDYFGFTVGFEQPSGTNQLYFYFAQQDDRGVGSFINGSYADYFTPYEGTTLRPGSTRTFADVSVSRDGAVMLSVEKGSRWVRCIAVWANNGTAKNQLMYTVSIEADEAFSHTWVSLEDELGDLNSSGAVDVCDVQCLYEYLISGEYASNEEFLEVADLNGDESVDVYDLQYLYEVVSQGQPLQ